MFNYIHQVKGGRFLTFLLLIHHVDIKTLSRHRSRPRRVSGPSPRFYIFYHFSLFQRTSLLPPSCKEFRDPTFCSWKSKRMIYLENTLFWYFLSRVTSWTFPSTWDDWIPHNTACPGQTCIPPPTDPHTCNSINSSDAIHLAHWISQNVCLLRVILVLSPETVRQHGPASLPSENHKVRIKSDKECWDHL